MKNLNNYFQNYMALKSSHLPIWVNILLNSLRKVSVKKPQHRANINTSDEQLDPLHGQGSSVHQPVPGDGHTEEHQALHTHLRAPQGLHLPQEHRQLIAPSSHVNMTLLNHETIRNKIKKTDFLYWYLCNIVTHSISTISNSIVASVPV